MMYKTQNKFTKMNPIRRIQLNLVGVKCRLPNCNRRIKKGEECFFNVPRGENRQIFYYCLQHEKAINDNVDVNKVIDVWEELNLTRRCIVLCFMKYIGFINNNFKNNTINEKIEALQGFVQVDLGKEETLVFVGGHKLNIDLTGETKVSNKDIITNIIQQALVGVKEEIDENIIPPQYIQLYQWMLEIESDKMMMGKISQNIVEILGEMENNSNNILNKLLAVGDKFGDTASKNLEAIREMKNIVNELTLIKKLKIQYEQES